MGVRMDDARGVEPAPGGDRAIVRNGLARPIRARPATPMESRIVPLVWVATTTLTGGFFSVTQTYLLDIWPSNPATRSMGLVYFPPASWPSWPARWQWKMLEGARRGLRSSLGGRATFRWERPRKKCRDRRTGPLVAPASVPAHSSIPGGAGGPAVSPRPLRGTGRAGALGPLGGAGGPAGPPRPLVAPASVPAHSAPWWRQPCRSTPPAWWRRPPCRRTLLTWGRRRPCRRTFDHSSARNRRHGRRAVASRTQANREVPKRAIAAPQS